MVSVKERLRRLGLRRWRKRIARSDKKRKFHKSKEKPKGRSERKYRSPILDKFCGGEPLEFIESSRTPRRFILPRIFSLTRNAEECLRVVREIVRYSRSSRCPRIILDHRPIKTIGLAAEALLAVVLKEISIESENIFGAYIKGYKPNDRAAREMMDEIGCVRVLGSGMDEDIRVSIKSKASVYRHQNRGGRPVTDPLQRDLLSKTSRDFTDHLDSCLERIRKKLSPVGREKLTSHIAEVLINAHEHSKTAQWLVAGYLDTDDRDLTYRAVIFSFGNTIAENFVKASPGSVPAKLVQPYIDEHERRSFFGRDWTKEELLTVIALQGHVSSELDEFDNRDRGQGTVDLIEFFQDMSEACSGTSIAPLMSMISGKAQILFDGRYRMKYENSTNRMVIAFNDSNSLSLQPDSTAVLRMRDEGFPGVVVSVVVPLTASAVEDILGEP